MSAMKELILIALMLVASIHCVAIKSEQSHGEHGKGKSGSHLGFFVSSSHVMYIKDMLIHEYSIFERVHAVSGA